MEVGIGKLQVQEPTMTSVQQKKILCRKREILARRTKPCTCLSGQVFGYLRIHI